MKTGLVLFKAPSISNLKFPACPPREFLYIFYAPIIYYSDIVAPLVTFNLCSFTRQIREEKTWNTSERNAITVFKTDGMHIVLTA